MANDTSLTNQVLPEMISINQENGQTGRDRKALGTFAAQPFYSPKYARHKADRHHEFEDTMARMYIQVPKSLYTNFLKSLPTGELAAIAKVLTGTGGKTGGYGYIDFLLQRAHHALNDKYQVVETLSDSYVAFFFGMQAPVFNYSGILYNTFQDDWAMRMFRIFNEFGRGTQLARRGFVMRLRYDSMIVNGAMTNFEWDLTADSETGVPFSFNLLVKSIQVISTGLTDPTNLRDLGFNQFEPESAGSLFVAGSGEAAKSLIGGAPVKPPGISSGTYDPVLVEANSGGVKQQSDETSTDAQSIDTSLLERR